MTFLTNNLLGDHTIPATSEQVPSSLSCNSQYVLSCSVPLCSPDRPTSGEFEYSRWQHQKQAAKKHDWSEISQHSNTIKTPLEFSQHVTV